MRRLIDPGVKLRVSFARSICLQATENLPSQFGEMTARIRRIHDIALLRWAIHWLEKRERPVPCDKVFFRDDLKPKLYGFYRDARTFFIRQEKVFFLHQRSNSVQLRKLGKIQTLDAVGLSDVLHSFLPPSGCLPLDLLAFLANRSHPNKVLDVFENSSTIQKHFTIVLDKNNQQFFYRRCDVPFATGHFFCANTSVATALEAASRFLPTVPTYWVPISMCLPRIPQYSSFVQNHGYRKIEGVLCGQIESAYYRRSMFIRRSVNCTPWKDVPKCTNRYEAYDTSPMRILKIAFCLPEQPASVQDCWKGLFPSIQHWVEQFPAFSLTEIAEMFPKAICVDENGRLRSLVRQQAATMKFGKTLNELDENDFDTAITDPENGAVKNALLSLVNEPSKTLFTPNESFQQSREHRTEVGESQIYKTDELFALILQCIQPDEIIPWTLIMERLEELPDMDKQKLNDTLNSFFIRSTDKFLRFILRNQPCPVKVHEKSTPGKTGYVVFFSRKDLQVMAEGNEYLDPEKLFSEVCHQIREAQRNLRGREYFVSVPMLASRLPLQARVALKAFGGFREYIKAHDDSLCVDKKGEISFRADRLPVEN